MQESDSVLKTALSELEHLLSTKTVVGEPIQVNGNTIVPLVSVGFGFGGGGGGGESKKETMPNGSGSGAAGGGGIKPIAVVIVDKDGHAHVESVRATASVVEKFGDAVLKAVEANRAAKTAASA
jgi:uncharacterized spore protein YtfJ